MVKIQKPPQPLPPPPSPGNDIFLNDAIYTKRGVFLKDSLQYDAINDYESGD